MKKMLVFGLAAMGIGLSAMAQNEHIHVFCSDKNFHTFKGTEAQSILYSGGNATTGFNTLVVQDASGNQTTISLSAIDSVQVRMTGLPEFHVNLLDDPTATELWGAKDLVHEATLRMDGNGMYDDLPEQTVEFRGRGNSTWNMKKKPYRFKMSSKAKVCGLAKAKSFALIANYIDCSLMRNSVALWVSNWFEMPYSNHCVPVKVYLNGIYKGAYMLTEKIGVGGGSVDIDENTGMLFELDSNYDEDFKFYFNLSNYSTSSSAYGSMTGYLPVMVKDPDLTEVCEALGTTTSAYFSEWTADFVEMAKAVMSTPADGDLSKYLDLESVAEFFVVNSLANNHEMKHPKSFYLYKKSLEEGEVYHFGPTWDFDWAFTFDGKEGASASVPLVSSIGDCDGYTFIKALFQNKAFRAIYKQKWDTFVADGYPELLKYMEEYATLIEPTAKENGLLWPADYDVSWRLSESSFEFRKYFGELKTWLQQRVDYCNSHVNYGIYQ